MSGIEHSTKELFETLLQDYEQENGVSTDFYFSSPCYHPMAEGKYLLCIAAARRLKLLDDDQFQEKLAAAQSRLDATLVSVPDTPIGFGLNFPYADSTENDRYLITTSIVMHGLLECSNLVSDSKIGRALIAGCVRWLEEKVPKASVLKDGPAANVGEAMLVPTFSDQHSGVIVNAISYYAGILAELEQRGISVTSTGTSKQIADWVLSHHIESFGWPYSINSTRFDLLHQCYVINGLQLAGCRSIELPGLAAISRFLISDRIYDKYDVLTENEAIERLGRSRSTFGFLGTSSIIYFSEEARLWSLGEALVTASYYAANGKLQAAWKNMRWKILSEISRRWIVEDYRESFSFFRQTMHIAHGLAASLVADKKGLQD